MELDNVKAIFAPKVSCLTHADEFDDNDDNAASTDGVDREADFSEVVDSSERHNRRPNLSTGIEQHFRRTNCRGN